MPGSRAESPTIRVTTNEVLVPTLVEKPHGGGIVYGLKQSDFVVEDNGVPQMAQKLRSTPDDELKSRLASPANCTSPSLNPTNAATGEAVARRQLSQWQYALQMGLAATENLTAPRRQPPMLLPLLAILVLSEQNHSRRSRGGAHFPVRQSFRFIA